MESITIADAGNEILRAKSSAMMGHPLNVVLWLIDRINSQGQRIKPGDFLSLGAMGTFWPTEPGTTIKALYTGLPTGNSEAIVVFQN